MSQDSIVIVAARRTPIGAFQGALSGVSAVQLSATASRACLEDAGIDPADVHEAIIGCVLPAGVGQAPARQAALAAGLAQSVGCTTVNKVCGSGMRAAMLGHHVIRAGSADVIHALFVPAFRVKRDVMPGRYTDVWFEATHPGEYDLYCAEYCGTSHSTMLAKVIVHPVGEFEPWLVEASDFLSRMPPAEAGQLLYEQRGCPQCHSMDGSTGTGPTFLGLFGSMEQLEGGGAVLVDENYVRESILNPQANVTAGYDPVMPTFQGRLRDEEIAAIIEFMKTLSE